MKTMALIAALAILASQFSPAQASAEKDLLQFEREACKAFLDADPATLERVLTADFTLTLPNSEVSTRAVEINELRSGKVHYDVFENYDMIARLYGDNVAVVLGKTRVKGTANGKPFNRVVQFTDTLIKRDGRWQLCRRARFKAGEVGSLRDEHLGHRLANSSIPSARDQKHSNSSIHSTSLRARLSLEMTKRRRA
jgi:hypothetical protein